MRARLVSVFACALLLGALTPRGAAVAAPPPPGGYYLAMGDSYAYGYVNDQTTLDPQCTSATAPGYVCVFYRYLKSQNSKIQIVNLAVPGADSCDWLHGYGNGSPCTHVPSAGAAPSQVDAAVAFLKAHPGLVTPITVNIGGNDLTALLPQAVANPGAVAALLPGILQTMQANIDAGVTSLQAAAPNATIILVTQPNPFSGVGTPPLPAGFSTLAATAVTGLNNAIKQVAAKHNIPVADAQAAIDAAPGQGAALSEVVPSLQGGASVANVNIHLSPQGYAVMGQAVISVYAALGVRLSVHLRSKVVARQGKEHVLGTTEPSAAVQVKVRFPAARQPTVFRTTAHSSGSFDRSFGAGKRTGKATVQVCVTAAGRVGCSAVMRFRVR